MIKYLIPPAVQNCWGWPAVMNFVLGGAGTGFYLLYIIVFGLHQGWGEKFLLPPVVGLMSLALVLLGFLFLNLEAGRPSHCKYLLGNIRRSWLSRESFFGGIFIVTVSLNFFVPNRLFVALSAIAALGFVISQSFIVYRSLAVSAWHEPFGALSCITSNFVAGAGLLLLTASSMISARILFVSVGICLIVNLFAWILYLLASKKNGQPLATAVLWKPSNFVLIVGIGHLLPLMFIFLILNEPIFNALLDYFGVVFAGTALVLLVMGITQKIYIILKVGHLVGLRVDELR